MKYFFITTALVFSLNANTNEPKKTEEVTPVAASDFRCEKVVGMSLAEFKAKLVENCDLNKPFSSSLSRLLNEETYLYCCQLKK